MVIIAWQDAWRQAFVVMCMEDIEAMQGQSASQSPAKNLGLIATRLQV